MVLIAYFVHIWFSKFVLGLLGPIYFGDFTVAFRVVQIAACIVLFGTSGATMRFLPLYLSRQDKNSTKQYLRWSYVFPAHIATIAYVLSGVAFTIIFYLHLQDPEWANKTHMAVYVVWIAPIIAAAMFLSSILNSYRYSVTAYAVPAVGQYLSMGLVFWIFLNPFHIEKSISLIALCIALAFILLACAQAGVAYMKVPKFLRYLKGRDFRHHSDVLKWKKMASQLIFCSIIYAVINALDILILEIFSDDEAIVGYYGIAFTVAGILWLIPSKVFFFIRPRVSVYLDHGQDGKQKLQALIERTLGLVVCICIVIAVGIAIWVEPILEHFGDGVLSMRTPVYVLLVAGVISSLNNGAYSYLMYGGHQDIVFRVCAIQLCVLAAVGIPLTIYFSAVGAAIAVLAGSCVSSAQYFYYGKKMSGLRLSLLM